MGRLKKYRKSVVTLCAFSKWGLVVVGGFLRPYAMERGVATFKCHVVVEKHERVVEKWFTRAPRVKF